MEQLVAHIEIQKGALHGTRDIAVASVSGRYYAMDRDKRWQRTELAYRAVVDGVGPSATSPIDAIKASYDADVTDEFIVPVVIVRDGKAVAPMRDGDAVIGVNYRADRMRQIIRTLIDPSFSEFETPNRPRLSVTSLTSYDKTFDIPVAFLPQSMANIIAEVLSANRKDDAQDGGNREVRACDLFLQRGQRDSVPRRGSRARAKPESCDVRFDAGDERAGNH
jgi:bisphosphoglycerate-independent phosphoglycerate mutase (AlkP superfamily)